VRTNFLRFATIYAFRSLRRNPRRTVLTIFTVGFSVAMAIIASRYSVAIMRLWQDGAADTGTAHAQIHALGYFDQPEGVTEELTIAEDNAFLRRVAEDPRVLSVTPRLKLEGLISVNDESLYFLGIGVSGPSEQRVSPRLFTANDVGNFVHPDTPDGVVVGAGLAQTLSLKIGDSVTLVAPTIEGSVNGIDATIVGIVDAGVPSFNKRALFTQIDLMQRLIRLPSRFTELAVRLQPGVDARQFVADLAPLAAADGVELRGWWQIEPIIGNVGRIWDSVVGVISALLFLLTGLSVLNIIFMMVAERTVEIGTLMAIGARGRDIRRLFAFEAALIGSLGGALGLVVGNLVVGSMDYVGVPFKSPFGSDVLLVHPEIDPIMSLVVLLCGIFICWLASIPPSRKASSVEPVRAFRGQIT